LRLDARQQAVHHGDRVVVHQHEAQRQGHTYAVEDQLRRRPPIKARRSLFGLAPHP
jgi:hypothetical protein